MISKDSISTRLNDRFTVTFTDNKIVYILSTDLIISVPRDKSYHFNEDGLDRACDLLDDPRFDYWYGISDTDYEMSVIIR